MQYQTILQSTLYLSGISAQLSNSQKKNFGIITNQWKTFNKYLKIDGYTGGKNWHKYGVIYKSGDYYHYLCAVDKVKLTNNFQEIIIEGGVFLKFQHIGSMHKLSTTYQKIYKEIIPKSELCIDNERTIIHYEYYDNKFQWNNKDSIIEIYIPIIKNQQDTIS